MILTKDEFDSLLVAAKPLMKWMSEHCPHPHCQATVRVDRVELLEGVASNRTDEFITD